MARTIGVAENSDLHMTCYDYQMVTETKSAHNGFREEYFETEPYQNSKEYVNEDKSAHDDWREHGIGALLVSKEEFSIVTLFNVCEKNNQSVCIRSSSIYNMTFVFIPICILFILIMF